jgi:hypothetical protein
VRQLFVSMYLDKKNNQWRRVLQHFEIYPPNVGCLRFDDRDALKSVMEACSALGYLLESGKMRAQMVVGEAVFDPINAPDKRTGHAFGFLHYNKDGVILEGTAWDRTIMQDDTDAVPECVGTLFGAVQCAMEESERGSHGSCVNGDTPQSANACTRKEMVDAQRAEMYVSLFTGDGCIFFEKGAAAFGISPDSFNSPLPIARCVRTDTAFGMSVHDLLSALDTGGSGWPKRKGASDMLRIYDECVDRLLGYRHALRPPPQSEDELMLRASSWMALGSDDLLLECVRPCTRAFTWVVYEKMQDKLKADLREAVRSGALQRRGCMHSHVFTYTPCLT